MKRNTIFYYKISSKRYNINDKQYNSICLSYKKNSFIGYIRLENDSLFFLYKNYNTYISNPCDSDFSYNKDILLLNLNSKDQRPFYTYILEPFDNKKCKLSDTDFSKKLNDTVYSFILSENEDPCFSSTENIRYNLQRIWFSKNNGFLGFHFLDTFTNKEFYISNRKYFDELNVHFQY